MHAVVGRPPGASSRPVRTIAFMGNCSRTVSPGFQLRLTRANPLAFRSSATAEPFTLKVGLAHQPGMRKSSGKTASRAGRTDISMVSLKG